MLENDFKDEIDIVDDILVDGENESDSEAEYEVKDALEVKEENDFIENLGYFTNVNEKASYQKEVDIDLLVKFHDHMFEEYDEDSLNSMVDSIKEVGIITPITVRPKGSQFEILSGHNRVAAAKKIEMKTIPAKVIEGLSDNEARIIVLEANFNQRSFSRMMPSMKAKLIREYHDRITEQKNHSGLIREISKIDNKEREVMIVPDVEEDEMPFELSPVMMFKYLKISNLTSYFLEILDKKKMSVSLSAQLGFLKHEELMLLQDVMRMRRKQILTKEQVLQLKKLSKQGQLNMQTILSIIMGEFKKEEKKEEKEKSLKISGDILKTWKENYDFFFNNDEQAIGILEKALKEFYYNGK